MVNALVAPGGAALLVAAGGLALAWSAPPSPPPPPPPPGGLPTDITGLLHWYDASTPAQLRAGGSAVGGFGIAATSIADRVAGGVAMSIVGGYANWVGTPRLVGGRGGITNNRPGAGERTPVPDCNSQPSIAGLTLGNNVARTLHLVWSRPNLRYVPFETFYPAACPILAFNGTTIATLTSNGTDTLALGATVLSSAVPKRHTMMLTLRMNAGGTIDTWLNGVAGPQGVANPLPASATGTLNLLGGDAHGNAGLYFHEFAEWDHALTTGEIATMLTGQTGRWTVLGSRAVPTLIAFGQSNASNFQNAAEAQSQESVRYHMATLGVNFENGDRVRTIAPAWGSTPGGTPLYATSPGTFLLDPGDASSPSGWAAGSRQTPIDTWMAALSSADRGDIVGWVGYYSEGDSARAYAEKATYKAALAQQMAHVRAQVGKTAAQLPFFLISALPFGGGNAPAYANIAAGTPGGMAMVRQAVAELAADASKNTVAMLLNTTAGWGNGADPVTGVGGDVSHLDGADLLVHAFLAGPVIARGLIASGAADAGAAMPAGLPVVGGPVIVSAHFTDTTHILVTVAHDAGNDLVFSTGASAGLGWCVMDGWTSETAPGAELHATAAARVSATTFSITLASAPGNTAGNCRLAYPWGSTKIGRGAAITDNYASMARPTGADIGADNGAAWAPNYPLAVPAVPVAFS